MKNNAPTRVTISARPPKSLVKAFKPIAAKHKRSMSAMLEWLMEEAVKQEKNTPA